MGQAVNGIDICPNGGSHLACGVEAGIEHAIGAVACQRKVIVAAGVDGCAAENEAVIGKLQQGIGMVITRQNGCAELAIAVKRGIERASGGVANGSKIKGSTQGSRNQELARIGSHRLLHNCTPIIVKHAGGTCFVDAIGREAGVERAVRQVPHREDLRLNNRIAGGTKPDHHNLAIGLLNHRKGVFVAISPYTARGDIGYHLALGAKTRV